MSVMARKTSEPTGGVFQEYVEDRRVSASPLSYDGTGMKLPAMADTTPLKL